MEGLAAVRKRDLLDLGAVVNMAVADPQALSKEQKSLTSPEQNGGGSGDFVSEKWW